MSSEQPTIIFGMPSVMGLSDLVEEALASEGFKVISLPTLSRSGRHYSSVSAWAYAKYRKIVHRDKDTATEMKGEMLCNKLAEQLQSCTADYALLMSADIYSLSLLRFIKKHTHKDFINYQFDGLHRFPKIHERIPLFDRFYVFDESDCTATAHPVETATNFYFPHLYTALPEPQYDFYFTGSHHESRQKQINHFAEWAIANNHTLDFTVIGKNCRTNYATSIQVSSRSLSFRENILRSRMSRILVDFVIGEHKGLSFRTFEALGMSKKLITTNAEVKKYDFYHPNNIFIWPGSISNDLRDFIISPYHPLPSEITEYYTFGNWLKRILHLA